MKSQVNAPGAHGSPAQVLYDQICRQIRPGGPALSAAALSWCHGQSVAAVALSLNSSPDADTIELWLAKGARRGDIPRRQKIAGQWVDIVPRLGGRPQAQFALASNVDCDPDHAGTVSCVVRDRLEHDRYYLLSCGHVLAGSTQARRGDRIEVSNGAGLLGFGELEDWSPVLGEGVPHVGIDAGIVRVPASLIELLPGDMAPAGVSASFHFDQEIIVKAEVPKSGTLKTRWSGYLDMPATERPQDYYLENAVGYRADPETQAGDSGAAVWTKASNLLLGIHVGAPVGDEQWRSNAILCPLDKIMQWFDVAPMLSSGQAYTALPNDAALASRPSVPPALPRTADGAYTEPASEDIDVVAMTLWGEARGEGEQGMRAVACVIGNRTKREGQQKGYVAVCREFRQFSCWNENDPNRLQLEAVRRNPDNAFRLAAAIARQLIRGELEDFTFGATHYFAASIPQRPNWAKDKNPCFRLGKHLFFNNIA